MSHARTGASDCARRLSNLHTLTAVLGASNAHVKVVVVGLRMAGLLEDLLRAAQHALAGPPPSALVEQPRTQVAHNKNVGHVGVRIAHHRLNQGPVSGSIERRSVPRDARFVDT